jgi:hypothetical protein
VDEICGSDVGADPNAIHAAVSHWHFHPEWMLSNEGMGVLRATHLEGAAAWLLFDAADLSLGHGNKESDPVWYAPVYGTLLPTWGVRAARSMRLPFSMLTWIDAASADSTPNLQRIAANADPHGEAIAARIVSGDFVSVFLLRPGEPSARDGRACGTLDYQTDARVLHVRTRGEALVALDLVDASHALALRDGWLSIAMTEPVRDLHLQLNDDVLEMCASQPPQHVRLLGGAVAGIRAIRLNGRILPLRATDSRDVIVISGAEWTATPLVRFGVRFALDETHPWPV